MRGQLAGIFIAVALFGAIAASTVWAGSIEVAIIYTNDINGQSDPIG